MRRMQDSRRRRGNIIIETALVFLPFVLLLVGVFEVGRAMWTYHSLSAAIKRGVRFAIVHGARCADASAACPVTIGNISQVIRVAGLGLEAARLQLTLVAGDQTFTCPTLSACLSNTTVWPASPNNAVGERISISGTYSFATVLFSLWPGQAQSTFGLKAKSTEVIQF